jgi:hypothetical protein
MEDDIDIRTTLYDRLVIKKYLDKVMENDRFFCYMVSTDPNTKQIKQVPIITRTQLYKLQATFPALQLCRSLIEDKRIYTFDFYDE